LIKPLILLPWTRFTLTFFIPRSFMNVMYMFPNSLIQPPKCVGTCTFKFIPKSCNLFCRSRLKIPCSKKLLPQLLQYNLFSPKPSMNFNSLCELQSMHLIVSQKDILLLCIPRFRGVISGIANKKEK